MADLTQGREPHAGTEAADRFSVEDRADVEAGARATAVAPPRPGSLRRKLIVIDSVATAAAWSATVGLPLVLRSGASTETLRVVLATLTVTLVAVGVIAVHRLYRARVCAARAIETARLGRAALSALTVMAVAVHLWKLPVTVLSLLAGTALMFFLLLLGRSLYRTWLAELRRQGASVWPVVLVGGNQDAATLHRLAVEHPEAGYQVRGVVAQSDEIHPDLASTRWLGSPDEVEEALRQTGATGVLIAGSALTLDVLNDVARRVAEAGYHVQISNGLRGIAHHRLRASPLAYEPLYYLEHRGLSRFQLTCKRVLDVALAAVALVVFAPVFAAVAAAVFAHDRGPVLFRQERVGYAGRPFTLLKFRTMVMDAEQRLADLSADNNRGGPLFKMAEDPRVTRVGRVLRATSLDELPQLLNVLRGQMSLVGPRPALPSEVEQFPQRLLNRHAVLPGITGLWQLEARDNPSFWSYERLDLFYVENWSVGFDLSILLGTLVMVSRRAWAWFKQTLHLGRSGVAPQVLE